jgi:hypothetical protein
MKACSVVLGCVLLGTAAAGAQALDGGRIAQAPATGAQAAPGQPPAASSSPINVPLNEAQKSAIRALQGESEQRTAQAAAQLAGIVQKIYENNLSDTPNEELRVTLDNQMRDLVWQMVSIKGNAMWTAFRLLTPDQKRIVRTEIARPRPTGDLPDVLDLIVRTFQVTAR